MRPQNKAFNFGSIQISIHENGLLRVFTPKLCLLHSSETTAMACLWSTYGKLRASSGKFVLRTIGFKY